MTTQRCCPYCKGTNGYQQKITVEYLQMRNWDGLETESEQTGNGEEQKTLICQDCNKKVTKFVKENQNETLRD